jgi:hypothetical protein
MSQDGEEEVIFEFLDYGKETFLYEEAVGRANPVRKSSTS